jgi:NADPH2:quinone reductase
MHAIRVSQPGGPEALEYQDIPTPEPGTGQALVQVKAIGVNFIDVYHRTGRYPLQFPITLGQEGAGVVAAVGPGVTDFEPGDRVAWVLQMGSYAEYAVLPTAKLIPVPLGVEDQIAAAGVLQGLTAHYLVMDTYPLKPGDVALIHAAAGGVGLLLTQLAKQQGARVIATVSTEEKARLAREAGADEIILYTQQDFEAETKRLTDGQGVHVVYDSVGKTTFEKGLNCLRPRGYMVLFGGSSGPAPMIDPITLMNKGSLFLTRPTLGHYVPDRAALLKRASDVFNRIATAKLQVWIGATYPLKDAAQAHRDLEARLTTGKVLLLP